MKTNETSNVFFTTSTIVEIEEKETPAINVDERPEFYY
jgi:hypothetical protein